MHKVLSGKTGDPRISTLQAIASYFGVSVDELYSTTPHFSEKEKQQFNIQSIPVISWEECLKEKKFLNGLTPTNWNHWVVVEHLGKNLYGLVTKPSMEPKLSRGSLLIIDPHAIPRDGDTVVVQYPNTAEATLREIIIDGPSRCLTSIQDTPNKSREELTDTIAILGCVIESRFGF
jgi:SOS-response transcriptional repressor LexA